MKCLGGVGHGMWWWCYVLCKYGVSWWLSSVDMEGGREEGIRYGIIPYT